MAVIREDWKSKCFAAQERSMELWKEVGPMRELIDKLLLLQREAEDDRAFAEGVTKLLDEHPAADIVRDLVPPEGWGLCGACGGTGIEKKK